MTVRALVCIFVDALAESFHSAVLDLSVADVVLTVLFSIVLSVSVFVASLLIATCLSLLLCLILHSSSFILCVLCHVCVCIG